MPRLFLDAVPVEPRERRPFDPRPDAGERAPKARLGEAGRQPELLDLSRRLDHAQALDRIRAVDQLRVRQGGREPLRVRRRDEAEIHADPTPVEAKTPELGGDEAEGGHGVRTSPGGSPPLAGRGFLQGLICPVRASRAGFHPGRVEVDPARSAAPAHRTGREIGQNGCNALARVAGHENRGGSGPAEEGGRPRMDADRIGDMLRLEQQERIEPRALHEALCADPIDRCLAHALSIARRDRRGPLGHSNAHLILAGDGLRHASQTAPA